MRTPLLLQVQKKKVTETLLPELHTSTTGVAMWKDKYMLTRHGACQSSYFASCSYLLTALHASQGPRPVKRC